MRRTRMWCSSTDSAFWTEGCTEDGAGMGKTGLTAMWYMPARDRQTLQDKQRRRRAAWEAAETNLKAGFPEDRHGTVIRQPRSVVVLAQMA